MKTPRRFARDVQTCLGLTTLMLLGSLCQIDAHVPASFKAQRRLLEKSDQIEPCLRHIGAKILLPGSQEYEISRKRVWNQRTLYHPAAIVLATTVKHVQKAVKCAVHHKVPISPRSGGHSYEGYGTGGRDGVLVVDLAGLKQFSFHKESMTTIAGPGLRLGQLYYKLWNAGKAAIPAGTCPTVGLGGHALGGGWGLLARKYGVAMDSILEMQVVTSTGALVTASKDVNCDLFAALKGAGHNNFGIVVEFKLQAYDLSAPVTLFEYPFSISDQVPVFKVFEEMCRTAPPEITSSLRQDAASQNLLSGTCLLPKAECEKLMQQYVEGLVPVNGTQVVEVEFIQTVLFNGGYSITDDPAVLDIPDNVSPDGGYIKAKDLIVKGNGLTDEGIKTFVDYLQTGPGANAFTIFDMYGNNSHTNKLPVRPGDGWVHRDSLYGVQLAVNYTTDPSNPTYYLDYADGWNKAVLPYADAEAFQNFMDVQEPLSYYYTYNLESLEATKRKWDQRNVFNYNQSIPLY